VALRLRAFCVKTVMEQLQSRGKDSSRERYASVFVSPSFDALRHKKLLETTAAIFLPCSRTAKCPSSIF
jgi:hypothetical protein